MFHRKSSKKQSRTKEVFLLHFTDIKCTTKSLQIAAALNKQWEKLRFGGFVFWGLFKREK